MFRVQGDNARLLEMENSGKITLEQRISLCRDNDLWSWTRRTKEGEKFYIDGSVLELFSHRLPDLTLKKLGDEVFSRYLWYVQAAILSSILLIV